MRPLEPLLQRGGKAVLSWIASAKRSGALRRVEGGYNSHVWLGDTWVIKRARRNIPDHAYRQLARVTAQLRAAGFPVPVTRSVGRGLMAQERLEGALLTELPYDTLKKIASKTAWPMIAKAQAWARKQSDSGWSHRTPHARGTIYIDDNLDNFFVKKNGEVVWFDPVVYEP